MSQAAPPMHWIQLKTPEENLIREALEKTMPTTVSRAPVSVEHYKMNPHINQASNWMVTLLAQTGSLVSLKSWKPRFELYK